ncbi:MAG: FadR family transcriptional regulator [Alphaproteobacteria bacterium]|nr:FadR family transcriptional regulator [Alphaproteobacteria bacterium]
MTVEMPATESAPERALAALRRMIDAGWLPRGSRLPAERDLATRLGVGRSTLRKSLAVLEAEGLLWRHVGRGIFVGGPPVPAGDRFPATLPSASPRDVMEARLMFVPSIAAAARSATAADIMELRRHVDKGDAARNWDTYDLWDLTLYRAIAAAAHNSFAVLLLDVINEFRRHDDWGRRQLPPVHSSAHRQSSAQHRVIVEAIAARDPRAAAEAMRRHLLMVRAMYFDGSESSAGEDPVPLPRRHASGARRLRA